MADEPQQATALWTGLAALGGSALTVLANFLLKLRRSDGDENKRRFDQVQIERLDMAKAFAQLRSDLTKQIADLKSEVRVLQAANLAYAIENTELKSQVKALTEEVAELRSELHKHEQGG